MQIETANRNYLLTSKRAVDRCRAIKDLAKNYDSSYLATLENIAVNDDSSVVRCEAVSAIGRQRDFNNISFLIRTLKDEDPKIVCQAIRGLLIFKGDSKVDNSLEQLKYHPNELVKGIILKEYFSNNEKTKKISHTQTYDFLKNVVVNADVSDVLKLLPKESIHLTFTSPPYYNARDYSIYQSYEEYLDFLEEVFFEIERVTKEGRFLIVNTSPIIIPRVSRQHSSKRYPIPFDLHARLVNIGWEFIDDIVWEKPEFSVKNRIGGFQQHRKPLGYKPNAVTEYLMVYRKKTDKLLDWNIHQYSDDVVEESKVNGDFETTNVWKISPKSDKIHSAVFPMELCKRVVQYYSYKGDLIFDPFAGSGTLQRTALAMDRYAFSTEKEKRYFDYMKDLEKGNTFFEEKEIKYLTLEQFEKTIE